MNPITNPTLYRMHAAAIEQATARSDGSFTWAFEMGRAAAFYALLDGTDGDAATECDRAVMCRLDALRTMVQS